MPERRRMRPVLGTYVEVAAHGPQAEVGLAAAFESLEASHARWSFHAADSELSHLNANPGQWVALSRQTLRLLRLARAMTAASHARFDCTVGGTLVQLGHLPDHGGAVLLGRGGADDLELRPKVARLRRPVRLTLDGIAKGFAVDLAVRALRRAGVGSGWVNAGGDLRVFGDAVLPVYRRETGGACTPLGRARNVALASSQSGVPATADQPAWMVGAIPGEEAVFTVMATSAWRADALTKVAAASPAEERADCVRRLGGHLLPWVSRVTEPVQPTRAMQAEAAAA